MLGYVIGGIVVLLIIVSFIMYNSFVNADNRVKEAFSTMDVYLKKRWDLIPNLVEVVKGYAKHEKETLTEVINLRNNNYDNMSNKEKLDINTKLAEDISKIMMLAEAYPELKANENFLNLSKELTEVEDEIANSRKYYNATVRIFNNKVEMFPSNIVAKVMKFKVKDMFEASNEERKNIKIDI
ncbi:MAG: LemA family protein [Bacilli bacterium]|nr:LemA family protein [Bacilli bacterium]